MFIKSSVIILDEPPGPLVPREVDALFAILRSLKESGVTIIFISHKLQEVMEICDTVSVRRDGKLIRTEAKKNLTITALIEWMAGEPIPPLRKYTPAAEKTPTLELMNIVIREGSKNVVNGVSLSVSSGEIVGIAGIEGNGQRELEEALAGLRPLSEGCIRVCGEDCREKRAAGGLFHGKVGTIPSHRLQYGMIADFSLSENLILGRQSSREFFRHAFINERAVKEYAERRLGEFRVRPRDPSLCAGWLSGGNQQKLVIARILSGVPPVLIAAHPTRGVSIIDANFIWQKLLEMKERGGAILLITADMNELLSQSDRIVVMFKGKFTAELKPEEADVKMLGAMMTGM